MCQTICTDEISGNFSLLESLKGIFSNRATTHRKTRKYRKIQKQGHYHCGCVVIGLNEIKSETIKTRQIQFRNGRLLNWIN